jgi:hypothetical protein
MEHEVGAQHGRTLRSWPLNPQPRRIFTYSTVLHLFCLS